MLSSLPALAVFLVFFGSSTACEDFPNGTASAAHVFSSGKSSNAFELVSAYITDENGNKNYPIDISKPIVFHYDIINHAGRSFNNLRSDSGIYIWVNGLFGCYWVPIPTFGLLDNSDPCKLGKSCPVQPGRVVIETHVDFSSIAKFVTITANHPTQFTLRLKDNTNPEAPVELGFITWQMKLTGNGKYLTSSGKI